MQSLFKRLLVLVVVLQCLQGCSVQQPAMPVERSNPKSDIRASEANQSLVQLDKTDVLVKFNSSMLAAEMEQRLKQQFSASKQLMPQSIEVNFEAQFIRLSAHWQIFDDQGERLEAYTTGEIQLQVSGEGLNWTPGFDEIDIQAIDFVFDEGSYAESVPELNEQLLALINAGMHPKLPGGQIYQIAFEPVPLVTVSAGTRIPSFDNASSTNAEAVRGMFFITGSALLIEPDATTLLLDMSFKPNLATCPADISVSRAMFARQIDAREPVGLTRSMGDPDDLQFFYSEISGASRPMTIIHYWFADGKAVAVEELPVGPSDKWRTWSSKAELSVPAANWRVLVVDKDSGCVLHSESIETTNTNLETDLAMTDQAKVDFAGYRQAFMTRTSDFPASVLQPEIGITELRSSFYRQVIQDGVKDMQIEIAFDEADFPHRQYQAALMPFETSKVKCQKQECADPLVCSANIAHCKRLRDTRECSSCLFHNPLNNRCVHVEEDPICVAAKNRQNAIYESEHAACIAAAEVSRQDCQQLSIQISQSCDIETRAETSACEASKAAIDSLSSGDMLGKASADSRVSGQLSTVFSRFDISGDFEQLQQDVTLKSRLDIRGELGFEPASEQWPLTSCISAWKGTFSNRALSSTPLNSMLAPLSDAESSFNATWSGIVLPLAMTASPLESVFVSSPQLLAACSIGLTVQQVEDAMQGEDAGFFNGTLKLVIQPLATSIELNPAYIDLAGKLYTGEGNHKSGFIRYVMSSGENSLAQ